MSENVSEWTPNQLRFIAWLATPSEHRKSQDHADLASEMGVAERTLYRWKKLPGLTDAAGILAREMVKNELADIYGALIREAKKGNFHHIKLALEVAEHYTNEVNVNVNHQREQVIRELSEFEQRRRAQLETHNGSQAGAVAQEGQA